MHIKHKLKTNETNKTAKKCRKKNQMENKFNFEQILRIKHSAD